MNQVYTFDEHLAESLKDPEFKKAWEDSEPEYLFAKKLIEARLAKKYSQRTLAKKLRTSQAAISRIEGMNGNPTLAFMKRLATVLGGKLQISI